MTSNRIQIKLLLLILFTSQIFGEKISTSNYLRMGLQMTTFLYLEYGIDHHVNKLNSKSPNNFDRYFREKLRWKVNNIDKAEIISDLLLYGVFLGSAPITTLSNKSKYKETLYLNLEVISINGIITNLAKIIAKRERPSSYYQTREEGKDSFRSFFSGHTSMAFAIGTCNSILLAEKYPNKKRFIWATSTSLALTTGYLRIASDKHYMTDIIMGAIVGTSIGKLVQNSRNNSNIGLNVIPNRNHSMIKFNLMLY